MKIGKIVEHGMRGYIKITAYNEVSHINKGDHVIISNQIYKTISKTHDFDNAEVIILVEPLDFL